jgi:hypothetical protein
MTGCLEVFEPILTTAIWDSRSSWRLELGIEGTRRKADCDQPVVSVFGWCGVRPHGFMNSSIAGSLESSALDIDDLAISVDNHRSFSSGPQASQPIPESAIPQSLNPYSPRFAHRLSRSPYTARPRNTGKPNRLAPACLPPRAYRLPSSGVSLLHRSRACPELSEGLLCCLQIAQFAIP